VAYDVFTAARNFTIGASLMGPNVRCERCGRMLAVGSTAELLDRERLTVVPAGVAGHYLGCNGEDE
jgi:hypothetical protein